MNPLNLLVRLVVARLREARCARAQAELDQRVVARIILALAAV